MNKNKTGLSLGVFGVIIHFVWSLLVMLGWGQGVHDFVMGLHGIQAPIIINKIGFIDMLWLLAIVFVAWYAIGWIFASVWNRVNR